ncbi:hypothetical protein EWM64_g10378 [Hericium alpestre]|uniref:Uncharacterized protein n=1 Tax=Hericium alpestre TaxID=135208 RepID=A0A4Y9ZGU1_9AGAM|nr:hypothetical protein EWM64_g10378 [Hericium alpestre]
MSAKNSRLQASESRSRARASRSASPSYLPGGAESLLLQDGVVGEQATELIQEFAHTREYGDETEIEVEHEPAVENLDDEYILEQQREQRQKLPWFIIIIPFSTIATTACLAPRIEIFTNIVCDAYKARRERLPPDWDTERLGVSPSDPVRDSILLSAYAFRDIPVAFGPWTNGESLVGDEKDGVSLRLPNSSYVVADETFQMFVDPDVQAGVATLVTGPYHPLSFSYRS